LAKIDLSGRGPYRHVCQRKTEMMVFNATAISWIFALVVAAAVPMSTQYAAANSCQQCRQDHNICRIKKKGHSSCDRRLEACLKRCLQGYRKR